MSVCTLFRVVSINIFMILIASNSAAEKVLVLSGDHDGFSRIVVHLPQRLSWTLVGTSTAKQLVLEEIEADWDLDQVFKRMSNERIKDLKPMMEGTGLAVDLSCNCDVEVFWHGSSMLVLDVKDPKNEDPRVAFLDRSNDEKISKDAILVRNFLQPNSSPVSEVSQKTAVSIMERFLLPNLETSSNIHDSEGKEPNNARRDIEDKIGRAASLGLVELGSDQSVVQNRPQKRDEILIDISIDDNVLLKKGASLVNVYSHNSSDIILDTRRQRGLQSEDGIPCIPNDLVDIEAWGNSDSFVRQMGEAHSNIGDENDQPYGSYTKDLVRLLLYFGFGAEAERVIGRLEGDGDDLSIYLAIAQLIDQEKTEIDLFEGQSGCDGDVAMWSVLDSLDGSHNDFVNVDATLRAFLKLPKHLADHIGPILIKKFDKNGQVDASQRALRIMERSQGGEKPNWLSVSLKSSDHRESENLLLSEIHRNNEFSPIALVRLIDGRLSGRKSVPPAWIDLAGSYAQELRQTDIGKALEHRYVRALAAAGQYDMAFDEINKPKMSAWSEDRNESVNIVVSYTVRESEDVDFLKHLGYREASDNFELTVPFENEVADRLLYLGFPSEALNYLRGSAVGTHKNERRLLRAEALLSSGSPKEAIGTLLGMSGADVDALRAEAYDQLDDHRNAWPLYRASGDVDGALKHAILADDWQEAASLADFELANVIEIFDQNDGIENENDMFSFGNALLAESEAIRVSIANMLDEMRASDQD